MMEQPILGSKLLALRLEKGITQLELREKCHVSVRTIQRIESGSVTPRASTIKILLEALDENPDDWFGSSGVSVGNLFSMKTLKNMLLIDGSEQAQKNALTPAWISGIIYLLMVILGQLEETFFDYSNESFILLTSSVVVKIVAAVSFFMFIRGFLSLSQLFENYLLKIASYLSITLISTLYLVDASIIIFNGYSEQVDPLWAISVIPIGAVSIIFGMGLLRLQDGMGRIAKVAGRIEVTFGISYVSLIFSFVGVILLAPLLVIEIVLLSKADQLAKEGQI